MDLSRIWAGPYCTKLFADMGAEIIKMESLSVYDSHRGPVNPAKGIAAYPDGEPGDEPWNRNGWFNCLHMSKYGVTLELTKDEGRRVFELLVSISDVVIENFRQGSLERLGYTYEELRKHRPDLIYVSMPAFGNTGPWKGYLGYGIGQEQLSGMAHMTGYRGEGPMKSGINHGDPITGSHAAGVLMAALRHRRRTGKGMYIDVSQQESSVALMGPEVLAYQMTGQEPERRGNRSGWYAPANSYRCAGEDRWVTISVTNQDQWRSLAQAMDADGLADDPRFATKEARRENHDDLDRIISEWTIGLEAYDLTRKLQRLGVPAGPVLRGPDLLQDAHYKDRGTFVTVDHPQVGPKQYPGIPWKMSATPGVVRWPSPTLGQHNREVYGELLGLNGLEIDQLDQTGVIGTKPTGSRII
ncbi:CAIB/BAIF family protein [hydrothermal vent metagenome]|uniref:CAIB/BAIF family protein n=1 Tax=hydrothermal vent metagenome TaxID=652676 RepID=A0A160VFD5_9ZZZZ